ncbi:hypothetical protein NDU88_009423 [Pleurodeles waltl]|uniref:Uncharacterized protein n=1 Tax=Pleurodeles waltl TaxID=8319 RepID=A0AAV7P805_PLEWA|nr:hypothetical protein NDU88_009423 [Pleurodeles waltl]
MPTAATVLWLRPLLLASAVHARFRARAHGRHYPVAPSPSAGLCSPCSLQGTCPRPPLSCGSVPFFLPLQSMLTSGRVATAATVLWLRPLLLASAVHARLRARAHGRHCPVAPSPSSGLCSPCSLQGACPRPPLSCGSVPFFWPLQSMLASGRVPTAATVLWLLPLFLASAVHARFRARAHGRHCHVAPSPSSGLCSPCSLQGSCPQWLQKVGGLTSMHESALLQQA